MHPSIRAHVLTGLALCVFSALLPLVVAQTPPNKLPAEEEDPNRPAKPRLRLQVPDEKPANRPAQAERLPEVVGAINESKSAVLRSFFQDLSVPHDVVTWKDGRHQSVEPLRTYVPNPPDPSATVNMHFYDEQWHLRPMHPESLREVQRVDHFESIALANVAKLLEQPAAESKLSETERREAAEKGLSAVLRFHQAARASKIRDGSGWSELENQLRQKLGSLQMLQLNRLIDADDWPRAIELAARLSQGYASDAKMRSDIGTALSQLVMRAADRDDYSQMQLRRKVLKDRFPDAFEQINVRLRRKAEELVKKARDSEARGDVDHAMQTIRNAETIDAAAPGLRDLQLQLKGSLPKALGVGVRDVPQYFSPSTAVTNSEKQALDLLFESLVRVRERPGIGQVFEPVLTSTPPEVIPLGRRFQLARDAYWSNGEPLSAADVRATVEYRLRHGVDPMWNALMASPLPSQEPFVIGLQLKQGQLEPLSLMTFKILPASRNLQQADDPSFASNPMGSGPFQLQRHDENLAAFQANAYYNRAGTPNIRQIQFSHSVDPPGDFQNGRLHLLLDLTTRETQPLESLGNVKVWTLRNRRIYFLAVNSRLKFATVALRRTIAHAINREQILQEVFRLSGHEGPHRALNGPFPPDCWASSPRSAKELYSVDAARAAAKDVKELSHLTLKCPDDESIKQACERIRDQVHAVLPNADITVVPHSVRQLHEEVEKTNDFDLAYYYYDFPNDLYSLWPLLHPNSFLGYQNSKLEAELQDVFAHRDPDSIRDAMHRIDDLLYLQMPFIPLWQLDTHVAIHNDLKIDRPESLDPAQIFADVTRWRLGDK